MRAALTGAVIACAALGLGACGGSKPSAAAPAGESAEASASDAPAEPQQPEESWGGDDAAVAKEGDAGAPAGGAPKSEPGGAAPAPTSGAPETRTTEAIAEVVNQNRAKVRACYEAVQKKLPDLKGDLVVKFTLDAEGKVKSAEQNLEQSTLKNPDIGKCAVDEIKTWKFPPSSRGMDTTVNYPFNFRPQK